jgi:molybdenum cofactor sulfurtransferase
VAGTQNASIDSSSQPADMCGALARFLRRYPAFAKTGVLDIVRATDYPRLDEQGHTYLDYTGGGLYAETQLRQHQELLIGALFGTPRSPRNRKAFADVHPSRHSATPRP